MIRFIFLFLICSQVALAGGAVGNGGDTVYCMASHESPYVGFYNLDYLANKIAETQYAADFDSLFAPEDDGLANMKRILSVLQPQYPLLAHHLKTYSDSIYQNSILRPYVWMKAPYGVVEIDDEQLALLVPSNCLKNGREKSFIQTIIRETKDHYTQFTYSTQMLNQLSPIQQSFLLTHEWLWTLTDDPDVIRNANAILHSKDWNATTAAHKINELFRSGLDFRRAGLKIGEMTLAFGDGCFGTSPLCATEGQIITGRPDNADFVQVTLFNRSNHFVRIVPEPQNTIPIPAVTLAPAESTSHFYGRQAAGSENRYCAFLLEPEMNDVEDLNCESTTPKPYHRFGLN